MYESLLFGLKKKSEDPEVVSQNKRVVKRVMTVHIKGVIGTRNN
jgi:hypothetical protein